MTANTAPVSADMYFFERSALGIAEFPIFRQQIGLTRDPGNDRSVRQCDLYVVIKRLVPPLAGLSAPQDICRAPAGALQISFGV